MDRLMAQRRSITLPLVSKYAMPYSYRWIQRFRILCEMQTFLYILCSSIEDYKMTRTLKTWHFMAALAVYLALLTLLILHVLGTVTVCHSTITQKAASVVFSVRQLVDNHFKGGGNLFRCQESKDPSDKEKAVVAYSCSTF